MATQRSMAKSDHTRLGLKLFWASNMHSSFYTVTDLLCCSCKLHAAEGCSLLCSSSLKALHVNTSPLPPSDTVNHHRIGPVLSETHSALDFALAQGRPYRFHQVQTVKGMYTQDDRPYLRLQISKQWHCISSLLLCN